MATKSINVVLALKDQFTNPLKFAGNSTRKLHREVNTLKREFKEMGATASTAVKSIALNSAKVGLVALGAALAYSAKEGLQLASDLQEVQNVVDVTFGQNSTINNWSKQTAQQFGIGELQAKQFSGTLGAMFKSSGIAGANLNNMSTSLTGLTGDFASFYNLDPAEAFDKIKAAMVGSTEPMLSLGINMQVANLEAYRLSKGIKTSFEKMSQGEKTQLRFNYLMEKSKDAQGDFSRTSGGFANQMRILKLNFNDVSMNIMKDVLPSINSFVVKLNESRPAIEKQINELRPYAIIAKDIFVGGLLATKEFVGWIKNNFGTIAPIVGTVIIAMGLYKAAMIAAKVHTLLAGEAALAYDAILLGKSARLGLASAATVFYTSVLGGQNVITALATTAQWAFNAALTANPIGLVIGLLAVLGLAIYAVVKHWKSICEWIGKAWDWLTKWNGTKAEDKNAKVTTTSSQINYRTDRIGRNANGTSNWRGGLTSIHERGGEIIDLPQGSRVYPHDKSVEMARNDGKKIEIHIHIGNLIGDDALAERVGGIIASKIKMQLANI